MSLSLQDGEDARALVVEGNPTMRSMLVAQLRDFGVGTVAQCGRIVDARRMLEYQTFDFVLCEQYFPGEESSGQELLNDLRRNQLLPFSTVFVMITGEATYTKVAEAAEAALDGYLLKPHKASQLAERLEAARQRKISLYDIFYAIEGGEFDRAAKLCIERFESRGRYWLYAARVGAELLLRTDQPVEARRMYQAVIDAKTLPWAKLGVARSMLEDGQANNAISTLQNLISEDPAYTDAYDVMGRAQFEMGRFDEALTTYKMAFDLTPGSISRMQSFGMMAFYSGNLEEAGRTLRRTCTQGLDSKLFDCQTLVLLAFIEFDLGDYRGLQRCAQDFDRLLERDPANARAQRFARIVETLGLLQQHKMAHALERVRSMVLEVRVADFDFEAASNLLALLALLAKRSIQLDEVQLVVEQLALRFASSRAMSELLVGAAKAYSAYAEIVRTSSKKVLKYAEHAVYLAMNGDPSAALEELLLRGDETRNLKLLESAQSLLDRYSEMIADRSAVQARLRALRLLCAAEKNPAAALEGPRKAGALSLRVGGPSRRAKADPPLSKAGA